MDYQTIIEKIAHDVAPLLSHGRVADYIPALAHVDAKQFGMAVATTGGAVYEVGDVHRPFSIQSISKVYTLTLAMEAMGEALWTRVGREPSGTRFNSLVQLEYENGIPRNPFINAGAIVVTDSILSAVPDASRAILSFVRDMAGDQSVDVNYDVVRSEKLTGHRNAALAHLMKSFGNLENEVEKVLDAYFMHCSIEMDCEALARSFLYLANGGRSVITETDIVNPRQVKRINALMLTCGLYDAVGDFAYRVGLPGKSGVGGGIAAVIPGELSVAVWSPGLNDSGNSLAGTRALELFTTYTGRSLF